MSTNTSTKGQTGARTRLLAYGLFGYCSAMVFLGPSVAEFGLAALGCPGNGGSAQSGCMGLAILPANALMPWLSVAPPVESTFLLLQQSWVLIAGWLVAIVLSVRSDRRRGLSSAVQSKGLLPNVIVLLLVAFADSGSIGWNRTRDPGMGHCSRPFGSLPSFQPCCWPGWP